MIFSLFWEGAFIRRGAFIRGGVYFKTRDFRGAFIRGGVYSRRGVYSRKYGTLECTVIVVQWRRKWKMNLLG